MSHAFYRTLCGVTYLNNTIIPNDCLLTKYLNITINNGSITSKSILSCYNSSSSKYIIFGERAL